MATAAEVLAHGWQIHQSGQWAAAEQIYRQVLQANPADANAWCYLGIACHDQDRWEEAVAAYRRALQVQPQFPVALNNLGNTLRMQRRLGEALACFDQALRLKPDYVNAHKNKGTALVWEGHLEEALTCYRRALEFAPEDAETHKNLGVILLLMGQFAEGWREYQWRWKTGELSLPTYAQPLWDGSSLDGRTIFLLAEQGLGDTVHFIRYAAELKRRYTCRVVAGCHRPLLALLAGCDGLDQFVPLGETPAQFDVFCPLLSVPAVLGDTIETFPGRVPYLAADEELVGQWRERLRSYGGVKIGIVWQGNPKFAADRTRSFPLEALEPLGRLHGIHLFSLQKGFGVEQLDTLGGRLDVVPLGDQLDETTGAFVETAAVLKNLDLVIAPDTALAHVAGALGVPVWLGLARVADWRWFLDRDDSVFYPTARLFRQEHVGDWSPVFSRMAAALVQHDPRVRRKTHAEFRVATSGVHRLTHTRHGLMLYNRHDRYIGRSLDRYGEFSEAECDLFRQLIRPGQTVVEAGANIGSHTVALSRLVGEAGRVYAFEPVPAIFQLLGANLALNGRTNVVCRAEALGDQPGSIVVPDLDLGTETNFGGVELGAHRSGQRVPLVTLDSLALTHCHFIKADVEGMELAVLQGGEQTIRRHRPLLYVENDRADKSPALIAYLQSLEYDLYWHLPPLYTPANFFENPHNEFPGIVSANMLGVHRSVKSSISGLRRVEGPHSHWQQPAAPPGPPPTDPG
jgi:FkbM family methyltransferase